MKTLTYNIRPACTLPSPAGYGMVNHPATKVAVVDASELEEAKAFFGKGPDGRSYLPAWRDVPARESYWFYVS